MPAGTAKMAPLHISSLLAAPVVDLDGTFFVQAGIFLVLMLILNPLLFKPWLETRARRAEAIEGAVRTAADLRVRADEMVADYESRLAAARERGQDLRASARNEEEAIQAKHLAAARTTATEESDRARAELARQAEAARADLGGRVDDLAQSIVAKLLGRA